jgi:hypothetical protein
VGDDRVQESLRLQQQFSERLVELGYADIEQVQRISRHVAEAATLGKAMGESTLPLFLQISRENRPAIAQVAIALKLQLEELADTFDDLRSEMGDWEEFFRDVPG